MEGAPELLISAEALLHNFRFLREISGKKAVFPVIKADAYGHGAVLTSRILEAATTPEELPLFCVARWSEARELRDAGVGRGLLLLSQFTGSEIEASPVSDLHLALHSSADVQKVLGLSESARRQIVGLHLNLNTGMNRLGWRAVDVNADGQSILEAVHQLVAAGLPVVGIMSHLACSEEATPLNAEQEKRFESFVTYLRAHWPVAQPFPRWIHLANSAATTRGLGRHSCNAVRPGLYLWGAQHDGAAASLVPLDLQPVLRLHAPIRQIFWLAPGEALGYGHRFVCQRPTLVGTVAFGYADGLRRSLSRSSTSPAALAFWVEGERAPILGTVSMDLTMIDLTDHSRATRFTQASGNLPWAEWIGPEQSADAIARACDTIPYEIFCAIAHRVKRRRAGGPESEGQLC